MLCTLCLLCLQGLAQNRSVLGMRGVELAEDGPGHGTCRVRGRLHAPLFHQHCFSQFQDKVNRANKANQGQKFTSCIKPALDLLTWGDDARKIGGWEIEHATCQWTPVGRIRASSDARSMLTGAIPKLRQRILQVELA
eukprot:gb/GFBE01031230.1/.p2 GENE.gb/GFBE01031230.1/~~gb/GFBE01031230.1/.p2  ORF type:complete len:138 (-),score=9.10 gb/GFBE01031230.1/:64-477(-)